MYKDITAVILAGGKSSRMGANKALMETGGLAIIEIIAGKLKDLFSNINIITNDPELYGFLGLPMYEDIYKGYGPLAGIHSGLVNSGTEKNFIVSCDIPLLTKEAVRFIVDYSSSSDIVVPKADGFVQQLCGIYKKSLIPGIEDILLSGKDEEIRHDSQKKRKCKVHALIDSADSKIIDFETEYPAYTKDLFFNMNRPEDFEYASGGLKV